MADAPAGTVEPSPAPAAAPSGRPWIPPAVLFALLMVVYHLNGGFLLSRDALPNLYLPVNLLTHGSLTFEPRDYPFMFTWEINGPAGKKLVDIPSWDAELLPGVRAREIYASGILKPRPRYFLIPSSTEGRFNNIYGPGAGLSAVPFFALLSLTGTGWRENSGVLGYEGKVFASACVAGSAVFVYLSLLLFVKRPAALAGGLVYGLGTCVWAEPTQALWQQTPTLFFVAMGTWFLLRMGEGRRFAVGAGLAYGAATLCRPTMALLAAAAGVYVLLRHRKQALIPFAAAGLAPVLLLLVITASTAGSPFNFGQAQGARPLAMKIQGNEDLWSTPLWEGASGLLASPSRGLLVFSPFFAFSFWGAVECWRKDAFVALRPLVPALAAILAVYAKWFQWHGGWCFGYRMIVELTPVWMVLLAPVAGRILASRPLTGVFAALAIWAVALQTLGAFAYDPLAWNARVAYEVQEPGKSEPTLFLQEEEAKQAGAPVRRVMMDFSTPRFRHRLWSVSDGQIAMLMSPRSFSAAGAARARLVAECFKEKGDTDVR